MIPGSLELDDVESGLDRPDDRQRRLVEERIRQEPLRRVVRRREDPDAGRERARQPAVQEVSVGDVMEEEFVEEQDARIRAVACDHLFGLAGRVCERGVQAAEEGVEVDALPAVFRQEGEVLLQQPGLAASDGAPEVDRSLACRCEITDSLALLLVKDLAAGGHASVDRGRIGQGGCHAGGSEEPEHHACTLQL